VGRPAQHTYPIAMAEWGFGTHLAVFLALVVNLWFGGDYIEAWFGHWVRSALELVLIGAWLILVIGMRAPLPWRRRKDGEHEDDRRS